MLSRSKSKPPGQLRKSAWYFYWTRPIGSPEHHFRLSLTVNPLWGCKHVDVDSLSSEIAFSRPCTKLEVIIARDTKSLLQLSVSKDDWDVICTTLGTYHGSSLASLIFVGSTQEQMMHMMNSLIEKHKANIQSVEISLSNEFPGETLLYLCRHFPFLKELRLLDPASNVLLLRFTELREFIECSHHLKTLVVESRFVVTSSGDRMIQDLDLLLYTAQQAVALEHVVFSFACAGQSQANPSKIKPKTLAELIKEPQRKKTTNSTVPQAVICPKYLSVSKDKLHFALACNSLRRELIGDSTTLSDGAADTLAIIEASLRVLKDWMNQGV